MPAPQPPTAGALARRHGLRLDSAGGAPAGAAAERTELLGVSHDSRRVRGGDLYAALPGSRAHGAGFVREAVRAGARAVLTDAEGAATVRAATSPAGESPPVPAGLPVLVAGDPRAALGPVCDDVLGHPSRALSLVGVTGTNGKTTVSFLVEELLRGLGERTGLVGTIRTRIGDEELPSSFTTPEAPELQRLLARMRDAGCSAAAAEVSSHALALHRVDGTRFALTVFTNLSQDHLDFHGTMAGYFAAKLRLLDPGFTGRAVVGVDDRWGRQAAEHARQAGLEVVTVGWAATPDGAVARPVPDVAVAVTETTPDGRQRVRLAGLVDVTLDLPMPGPFNAVNAALAVTSVAVLRGGDDPGGPARLARRLGDLVATSAGVPGRMERVLAATPDVPLVVVDYAHTPDAVAGAVRALRAATPGHLAVVVGAGGDRDPSKRPAMGAAAAAADLVVVTDDNPRSEDPAAIRSQVLSGARDAAAAAAPASRSGPRVLEVADRREAVRAALAACGGPSDTVLLAGKGHEPSQVGRDGPVPFDDREVARELLAEWSLQGVS